MPGEVEQGDGVLVQLRREVGDFVDEGATVEIPP
jgi:hypothetical protein